MVGRKAGHFRKSPSMDTTIARIIKDTYSMIGSAVAICVFDDHER
jgi:hypothetical protein